ncbi:hypothetical protein [uncultured Sphingomonas sp.]|uniref:hypothetical protein n=1 Tax=uncultured Sphingomonas sp. TaxID=158754 RepID=UPI00258AAB82|nr:hypothetical protein [uncultured Sphingomonas sp.]
MVKPENLLIVGAGFSANAGLPIARSFTDYLVKTAQSGPSRLQVRFIKDFVEKSFGNGSSRSVREWPELEDIFTVVDLSANTGHHLGHEYSASDLRVVRRAIIVRMIRMLEQRYQEKEKAPDDAWRQLEKFFKAFNTGGAAVLSMNWDSVFERGIGRNQAIWSVDYGCDAHRADSNDGKMALNPSVGSKKLHLLKPHGSVNWLYCDCCRETFWLPPNKFEEVARTLFREQDWRALERYGPIGARRPKVNSPSCANCGAAALGTRFATFSYRKALDFPMHAASWQTAKRYLREASHWTFIGYSMPSADFEFKYLLKRVQLARSTPAAITVITGGGPESAKDTEDRFKRFFGPGRADRFYFRNSIDDAALSHLQSIGLLQPR